jgi:hypothetical protein
MSDKPRRVREPVQAWLDEPDAQTLADLSERTALPKAEVIRQAIRRMARDLDLAQRPGAGLSALTGVLGESAGLPADLAANHDEYLYGDRAISPPKARRR